MSAPRLLGILFLLLALPGAGMAAPAKKPEKKTAEKKTEPAPKPAPGKLPPPPPLKVEWKPAYYKNRAYVPAEQVSTYYDLKPPVESGKSILLKGEGFSLEFTRGEKMVQLNGWTFYFSFAVTELNGKPHVSVFDVRNVLDPILRPGDRRDPAVLKTVILDPAAGGKDSGIKSAFISEKELTLDVAKRLRPLLEAAGFNVLLTRESDEGRSVTERVRLANAVKEEAIFISLRAGSSSGSARGFESSTLPPAGTPATFEADVAKPDRRFFAGNIDDRESLALATTLQSSAVRELKVKDLGIKRQRWEELRDVGHAAVVCRVGFLSNKEEAKQLADPEHRQALAMALLSGVQRYAKFLTHGIEARAAEDAKRPLKFGTIEAECVAGKSYDGDVGQNIRMNLNIQAAGNSVINRSLVEVQVYLFENKDGAEIDLTTADPPVIKWLSVLPDWMTLKEETLQVSWTRPPFTTAERKTYGRRTYRGWVARLIYDGQVMDEAADPPNLNRALMHFLPVFPKR